MNFAIILAEWDTATVMTVILAPLCIALLILFLAQMQRINELKNDKESAFAKSNQSDKVIIDSRADFARRLTESSAQKDEQIQRQKKEIEGLHGDLFSVNQALDLYRGDSLTHDKIIADLKAEIERLNRKTKNEKIA